MEPQWQWYRKVVVHIYISGHNQCVGTFVCWFNAWNQGCNVVNTLFVHIIQPFYNFTQIWSQLSLQLGELLPIMLLYKQNISNIPSCYKYWILNQSFSSRSTMGWMLLSVAPAADAVFSMNLNWLICCILPMQCISLMCYVRICVTH